MEHSFNASSFNLSADSLPPLQEHPYYKEGMVHIDAGRWREAFDSFQHLAELYPEVAEAQRLLDDIKIRATLSEVQPNTQSRAAAEQRVKRMVTGILVTLIIVPILYVLYDLWLGPFISQEWRRRQVTEIQAQADQALTAGDYPQAQQLLEQLQVLLPEDPETAAALSQIKEVSQLTTLYDEAKSAMAANNWEQAAIALSQLQSIDSEYRDVPELLVIVEKSRPLEAKFQAAETALGLPHPPCFLSPPRQGLPRCCPRETPHDCAFLTPLRGWGLSIQ